MSNKKNEIVKKETSSVPNVFQAGQEMTTFDPKDILIPKVLLQQGMSKAVQNGEAAVGDMINSVTHKKLGDKTKPLHFVPLVSYKTWMIMEVIDGKEEYKEQFPFSPDNASLQWRETVNGVELRRYPCLNFYVFVEEDLSKVGGFPYLIVFKSTSYSAGRKIINHFAEAAEMGAKPLSGMLTLSCRQEKGDKGPYFVYDVAPYKDTPVGYAPKLLKWEAILKQNMHQMNIDNSDLQEAGETDITPPSTQRGNVQSNAQF